MFRYTPQTIPTNIFVIGGGGTGSRLMPMLVQFIRSITRGKSPMGWLENPTIWVVDDDTVELKNLLRQNFIDKDVNKPKAQVLAERYGRAYDVDVVPIIKRVESSNSDFRTAVQEVLSARQLAGQQAPNLAAVLNSSIVISCVDSAAARRNILNNFIVTSISHTNQGCFFIDAGNEDSFGQVNFFTPTVVSEGDVYNGLPENQKVPKMVGSICDINFLPMDVKYYRDLVDTVSTASCADLNQTLAINAIMATTIMGIVQNYYYRKPFQYNCVRFSLDGANATEYCTFNSLKRNALEYNAVTSFMYGSVKVKEKNNLNTTLTFGRQLQYVDLYAGVAVKLLQKIGSDKVEAERLAKEEEDRLKAEEALTKKAMASEASIARLKSKRKDMNRSTELKVLVEEEGVPVGTTVEVMTANPVPLPPSVEASTAASRNSRRRNPNVTTGLPPVEVPQTWIQPVDVDSEAMNRAIESVTALRNR
jgi:molybdopterin/thiamine biosynthesis adenylyltransferase